jgi:adenylate cyclase class 2
VARGSLETEIKLAVPDAAAARRLLRTSGFRVARRRAFESNAVFDTPERRFGRGGALLRVRESGRAAKLTYKGPAKPSKHKSREEREVEAGDAPTLRLILERLGFVRVFRYEKYRAEYRREETGGVVTLDETPIGVYLELEGTSGWIDRTARRLGFTEEDYITASYGRLYLEWCAERGRAPRDMLFRP